MCSNKTKVSNKTENPFPIPNLFVKLCREEKVNRPNLGQTRKLLNLTVLTFPGFVVCHQIIYYHEYCKHTTGGPTKECSKRGRRGCLILKGTENLKSYCRCCWMIKDDDTWGEKRKKILQLLRALGVE